MTPSTIAWRGISYPRTRRARAVISPERERPLQARLVAYATLAGYRRVYHTFDSRRSPSGFPDLVLLSRSRGRVLFIELKADDGVVTPEQAQWLIELSECGQEAYLFRPSMWDDIVRILTGGKP